MKDLKQFIGIYPVSKTLRFELKTVGRTQEWIERNHVLEHDWKRAEDYPKVKEMIDAYHKLCISKSLKNVNFDIKKTAGNYLTAASPLLPVSRKL